ncbi:MAG: hypothetical protein ACTSSK_05840 [Candidatus Heimdallarchaeota archaeon]
MNESTISLIVFFVSLYVFLQIRFLVRYRRMKRYKNNDIGSLHISDVPELLYCCNDCACEIGAIAEDLKGDGDDRKVVQSEKSTIKRKRIRRIKRTSKEDKIRNKVLKFVKDKERTSLSLLCEKTSTSKDQVIAIIIESPDFSIDDDFILNNKLLATKEQAHLWKKISEKHRQEDDSN